MKQAPLSTVSLSCNTTLKPYLGYMDKPIRALETVVVHAKASSSKDVVGRTVKQMKKIKEGRRKGSSSKSDLNFNSSRTR
jgi:hypothetical protein